MDDGDRLQRRLAREKEARKQAEALLEAKSRELYLAIRDLEDSKVLLEREIEERRQAEEVLRQNQTELQASEGRLRAIMGSVYDAVISMDAAGVIQTVNPAALRIFGYDAEAMAGLGFRSLIAEAAAGAAEVPLQREGDAGRVESVGVAREVQGRRRDGSAFAMELAIARMEIPGPEMFVCVCKDISRRKREEAERLALERELSQAQKMEALGTLSGGIAHEINTPVQYVGDNIRFLQDAFGDLQAAVEKHRHLAAAAGAGSGLAEAVAEANAAAEQADLDYLFEEVPTAISQTLDGVGRISEIVQAIKEFSHPDTKEQSAVDINKAITTTATVTRNQWKYAADLDEDFDDTLPLVPCFPGEINQVILNLIVNAAHAIEATGREEKGRISVRTRCDGDFVEISVTDTGTGMPEEIQEKIFNPFFTTKEPGKGTGQGLAISHSIVTNKHGGTLNVTSKVGEGSTFTVRLPLAAAAPAEEAA